MNLPTDSPLGEGPAVASPPPPARPEPPSPGPHPSQGPCPPHQGSQGLNLQSISAGGQNTHVQGGTSALRLSDEPPGREGLHHSGGLLGLWDLRAEITVQAGPGCLPGLRSSPDVYPSPQLPGPWHQHPHRAPAPLHHAPPSAVAVRSLEGHPWFMEASLTHRGPGDRDSWPPLP